MQKNQIDAVSSATIDISKYIDTPKEAAAPGVAVASRKVVEDNKTGRPIDHYVEQFAGSDPVVLATSSHVPYDEKRRAFDIVLMGKAMSVIWPSGVTVYSDTMMPVYPSVRILLLRLLLEGSLVPATGKFLSYAEIPWGPTYLRQFNGKNVNRLARMHEFADQLAEACQRVGGSAYKSSADCSYEFEFLPGLFVRAQFWEGDDEFEPQAQLLFSDNVPVAFTAEDVSQLATIFLNILQVGHV